MSLLTCSLDAFLLPSRASRAVPFIQPVVTPLVTNKRCHNGRAGWRVRVAREGESWCWGRGRVGAGGGGALPWAMMSTKGGGSFRAQKMLIRVSRCTLLRLGVTPMCAPRATTSIRAQNCQKSCQASIIVSVEVEDTHYPPPIFLLVVPPFRLQYNL